MTSIRISPALFLKRQRGVSLVELLVASTIGLFVIAGAISVFSANQVASRVARDYDMNQEALRYASHTISRVVRSARTASAPDGSSLVVTFANGGVSGADFDEVAMDCLGEDINGVSSNTFSLTRNPRTGAYDLQCSGATETQTVVEGLAQDGLLVVLLGPDRGENREGQLIEAVAAEAISVQVTLEMMTQEEQEGSISAEPLSFVTTMRCRVVDCE